MPKEPAVAALGESREVERPLVNVLQKRRIGVEESVGAQHPVDLGDDARGLEHGFDDDGVDARIGERNRVPVRDELRVARRIDVEADEIDRGVVVERVDAAADRFAADEEDDRPAAGGRRPCVRATSSARIFSETSGATRFFSPSRSSRRRSAPPRDSIAGSIEAG